MHSFMYLPLFSPQIIMVNMILSRGDRGWLTSFVQKSDLAKTVLFSQIIIAWTHSKIYHLQTYTLKHITSIVVCWVFYVM